MSYKVNLHGGRLGGSAKLYDEKIGGYIRFTFSDQSVEEYYRTSTTDAEGIYEVNRDG